MNIDKTINLSLINIQKFLNCIDNPQDKISNIIHIAGTNGKGSTLSFIRSILEYHGYRVNTFTSPHLIEYRERFYLSGHHATLEQITEVTNYFESIPEYQLLSPFEAITAIAFQLFYKYTADYLILETGLGGRLDATNVVQNVLCSVITKIGFDHQKFLGNTLVEIASEKAGIIKNNSVVVSDYQESEVIPVLAEIAKKKHTKLFIGGKDYQFVKGRMVTKGENFNINPSLLGDHQNYNASLAIACVLQLPNLQIKNNNILQEALYNTKWSGRIQEVNNLYGIKDSKSKIFLDGAHNQLGAKALQKFINNYITIEDIHSVHIIFAMLQTKSLDDFLFFYKNMRFLTLYPITTANHNSYSVEDIIKTSKKYRIQTIIYKNIKEIITNINRNKDDKKLIIICGSLYLLGQVLEENNYKITL